MLYVGLVFASVGRRDGALLPSGLMTLRVPCHRWPSAWRARRCPRQWPQWRGPGGLGISAEKDLPTEWSPATKDKPAVNIGWVDRDPRARPLVADRRRQPDLRHHLDQGRSRCPAGKAQEHLKFDYTPGYIHPDAVDIEFKHALKVFAVDAKTGRSPGSAPRTTA